MPCLTEGERLLVLSRAGAYKWGVSERAGLFRGPRMEIDDMDSGDEEEAADSY